jgi:hypothetical protein
MPRIQRFFVFLVLFMVTACSAARTPEPEATTAPVPAIAEISPNLGRMGEAYPIQATIRGHGFAEEGNVVTFGGIPTGPLPSTEDGTMITFWVPKEAPSKGEVPPMILTAGKYEVTVTTPAGTSEPVTFQLIRGD